jgi:hypothetical protein
MKTKWESAPRRAWRDTLNEFKHPGLIIPALIFLSIGIAVL